MLTFRACIIREANHNDGLFWVAVGLAIALILRLRGRSIAAADSEAMPCGAEASSPVTCASSAATTRRVTSRNT
jgi:hypothetical protein